MTPPPEPAGGCIEFARDTGVVAHCCGSCHYEFDAGYYEPSAVEHEGKTYLICCGQRVAYDKRPSPSTPRDLTYDRQS
jgi:hypothetical protein